MTEAKITRGTDQNKKEIIDDLNKGGNMSQDDTELNQDKVAELRKRLEEMKGKAEKEATITTKKERSLEMGIIGTGQAGSRIAEQFYKLGYKTVIMNTATQDLQHVDVPDSSKLFMNIGIQGAAKDLNRGQQACEQYIEEFKEIVIQELLETQIFVIASSLGGGSGAGSLCTIIEMLQSFGKPIVVLGILPMVSEDVKTKSNTLEIIAKLAGYVKEGKIHNLITVDNSRIETIYAGVSQLNFFNLANAAIVKPIDIFNTCSMLPSHMKALDSAEWSTILLNGEGLSIYGELKTSKYAGETDIAEAVIASLSDNLLASSFDLKEAKYVGVIVLGNKDVLDKVTQGSINYMSLMIGDVFGNPEGLFKGIYVSDDEEDEVKIFTFVSGLGLPAMRLSSLKKDVEAQQIYLKDKSKDRANKLNLETNKDTAQSDVEKLKAKLASKGSGFGKLTGSLDIKKGIVDRRK